MIVHDRTRLIDQLPFFLSPVPDIREVGPGLLVLFIALASQALLQPLHDLAQGIDFLPYLTSAKSIPTTSGCATG